MTDRFLRVRNCPPAEQFDLLVISVGYESRSRHVGELWSQRALRRVAYIFGSDGLLSYDTNLAVAQSTDFEVHPLTGQFAAHFSALLRTVTRSEVTRVAIDISSFTKFHIAEIVDVLNDSSFAGVEVDFLYAPASSDNWVRIDSPIQFAEPIHPAFASWTDDPALPLAAIIGLGVEENLALGVAEQLDVSVVHAFHASGSDAGFDQMESLANQEFLLSNYAVRSSDYDMLQPFDLFARLESLVYGLRSDSRIAIIPLGPKIFALCALLATTVSDRAATVWRFSSGISDKPTEVQAAGPIASLRVSIAGEQ